VTQGKGEVRRLLERYGLTPRRNLGQHFLADPNLVGKLVELVGDRRKVVEVGPGTGTLTRALAEAGHEVLGYEIDERLRPLLDEVLAGLTGVEVRYADALSVLPADLGAGPWTMVSNLPYNVGTPLLMKLLVEAPEVDRFVVMVQKEVGDRLLAGPGSRTYGIPSVVVALHADARREFTVGPQVFYPAPQVESVVITLQRRPAAEHAARAVELAAVAFNQRRKMLRRSLAGEIPAAGDLLAAAGISGDSRAEQLGPGDYVALAKAEVEHGG